MHALAQRSALVPISDYITTRGAPASSMKLLEIAGGTGRFHTFLKVRWKEEEEDVGVGG